MNFFDSLKSYGMVCFGWMVTSMDLMCGVIQKLTVILVFVGLIVRLIHDIPKSIEAVRNFRKRKA